MIIAPNALGSDLCANVPQWSSADVYTGDKQVSYDGDLWKAKWWTLNDKPGHNQDNVWVNLGACNGEPESKPDAPVGSGACANVPQWNSAVAYTGSKKVAFNGDLWQAKWWTQNNEPGHNQENVWTNLGPCGGSKPQPSTQPKPKPTESESEPGSGICSDVAQWNSGSIYVGDQKAVYNGDLWKAKWWTRSDEPGHNQQNVWLNLGSCDGKPNTVKHTTTPKPTTTKHTSTPKPTTTKHTSTPKPTTTKHEETAKPTTTKHAETTKPATTSKTETKPVETNKPSQPSSPSNGFDASCNDNVVMYWGQNSYGGSGGGPSGWQKNLAYYCQDDTVDVIPVAFLDTFFGTGGLPELNLANTCNMKDNKVFPNSNLLYCPNVGEDIKFCQSRGKSVVLSLGGAGGSYGFQDDAQAKNFATQLWNLFLGGESNTRPFGDAILDGVDLDIEGGGPTGYVAFVNQLRSHYEEDKRKKYLVTGAPQCVYPDANLGSTLNNAWFDLVFVQFYNNPCGLQYYDNYRAWNFGVWDYWATHISPNPDVKVYIGAPAAPKAAGSGYVPINELKTIAQETRSKFTSFGGVMFWDASQAWANQVEGGNYGEATKQFLKDGGSCNAKPDLPACSSAAAWSSGGSYPGGSMVSHNGYIWKSLWWVNGQAPGVNGGYWSAISACSKDGHGSLNVDTPKPEGKPSTPTSTSASCSGAPAWVSSEVYTGGHKVSYNGHLWQAKWWTQNNTPGKNQENVWVDLGACNSIRRRSRRQAPEFAISPRDQLADFLVQRYIGDYLVTFSNLKLESEQFQMGVKVSSQKPGHAISDQWKLSFPFNSTVVKVDGATSKQEEGALVLSAITPKQEFKATQYMSVFVDVHGKVDGKSTDRFPFPDITKAVFSP
ncbi:glycoside hydrolase [Basidiobolus meristosporus CBS 931.73]|uniref:chitinase n=1 Tax=Basidiobolus meristosporus CBS 931.73 TaxID=1314790 RepID=A0A1Y1XLU6_9FUNG|nr:glycoside hydrolase [Basidiobolus meristosporus CBS 931.73]|eukprot:ORX86719.1 glycoside hydrolase [Basidiobolus meristosporus CBS 931.73]